MSMRSPLARVRGLGSAKGGTHHWWVQRLTSIALVPLVLWFAASVAPLAGASHAEVVAWLASPVPAVLTIFLVVVVFHHLKLGLEVVIEDYVPVVWQRTTLIICVTFGCILFGAAGAFAVLQVALGG